MFISPLLQPSGGIVFCKVPFGADALCLSRGAALNIESGEATPAGIVLKVQPKKVPQHPLTRARKYIIGVESPAIAHAGKPGNPDAKAGADNSYRGR